jgi:hypothetical protein
MLSSLDVKPRLPDKASRPGRDVSLYEARSGASAVKAPIASLEKVSSLFIEME